MNKTNDYLHNLKIKKDLLFHAVRTRDRVLYDTVSREWMDAIRRWYGVVKDSIVFDNYRRARNKIKKISQENGHRYPWDRSIL